MRGKIRLTGIDFFRGLAIFAVVIVHADEGITVELSLWNQILEFSGFAVPFFVATSFYFGFCKICSTQGQYNLKSRLTRLMIPYFVWTGIYIVYRILKYLIKNETESINQLFQDPIGLIFFGGAAFQLYFLPLLAAGTIWVKPLSSFTHKKHNILVLFSLLIFSLIVYELVLYSGNSFVNGAGVAFQTWNNTLPVNLKDNQILRIILVFLAWTIRCFPYIFMAIILAYPGVNEKLQKKSLGYTVLMLISFCLVNRWGHDYLPEVLYEVGRGYLALLLALALSNYLPENKWIKNLAFCSFGIYLIHLLVVETFQIIENRVYPGETLRGSSLNLLIFALLSLVISWIATDLLMRRKKISQLMFGN
ncbi:acyltransferase [Limnoraphis robusta Tam1]|uniref:Acyltransferase n=1 Tax=Limnoraphis robusta CCNP1315 TaxID=3110306 RepID=A0ABU5TXL1_9CYAN|nr:acyltransferase [Limnoraphis robusta]MEA5497264.1 acyltransferase [Limnoraphis robusta BA-68 BA1]MEA5519682.1 acyltransferase [Limnoraphis robusta CCNP1315]MEA5540149.1 acyltransferase [Limnoraphis robusta Tam1]MEA5544824.1 acyltransferase [Limnoraphis robusta CCNP1324]